MSPRGLAAEALHHHHSPSSLYPPNEDDEATRLAQQKSSTTQGDKEHAGRIEYSQRQELDDNDEEPSSLTHKEEQKAEVEDGIHNHIPEYLRSVLFPLYGDFCQTPIFHPRLLVQLMAEGFLPIATEGLLLPKLHEERCVIPLVVPEDEVVSQPAGNTTGNNNSNKLHIRKSTRKKSNKFTMTINQAFDDVVEGCHMQHDHCWLYPPLVQALSTIAAQGTDGVEAVVFHDDDDDDETPASKGAKASHSRCIVRVYSIEVWYEPPKSSNDESPPSSERMLVAGELGYSVGSIYTSLTGFSDMDGAGSVQLAALGRWLCQNGFELWDLGMHMDYKESMGAQLMPRNDFVDFVHRVRSTKSHLTLSGSSSSSTGSGEDLTVTGLKCRQVIDGTTAATPTHDSRACSKNLKAKKDSTTKPPKQLSSTTTTSQEAPSSLANKNGRTKKKKKKKSASKKQRRHSP